MLPAPPPPDLVLGPGGLGGAGAASDRTQRGPEVCDLQNTLTGAAAMGLGTRPPPTWGRTRY